MTDSVQPDHPHNLTQPPAPSHPALTFPMNSSPPPSAFNPVHANFSPSESFEHNLPQPPPLALQRNLYSVQELPQLFHRVQLNRHQSTQPELLQPRQFVESQHQIPGAMLFRQESLRGRRVVQLPSTLDLSRGPSTVQNNNGIVVIPINYVPEEGQRGAQDEAAGRQQEAQQTDLESGRQEEQEQDSEHARLSRIAASRVRLELLFNTLVLFCYIMGYLLIEGHISVEVIFGVAGGFILAYMVASILAFKKETFLSKSDGYDLMLSIANMASMLIYFLAAFEKSEGNDLKLAPFSVFGFVFLFVSCCKNTIEQPSASKTLVLLAKIVFWLELLLIGLKIDDVDLSWGSAVIPLYFSLMLMAFSSVLIIFGAIFAFCGIMSSEGASSKLVAGSIWYILNAFYPGIWLAILTEIVDYLDYDEGNITSPLKVGIIHSGILLIYTLVFYRLICKFQEFEVQSEMLINPPNVDTNTTPMTSNSDVKFHVSKTEETHLVMISPSFYTLLNKQLKSKNQKEVEALRNEAGKVKMERFRHGLQLNEGHNSVNVIGGNMGPIPLPQKAKNLDFSENDIEVRRAKDDVLPVMKKCDSTQSTDNLCTICYDSVPNAVFMDCGHGGVCYVCALENWKKTDSCFLCRQKIKKVFKIVTCRPLNTVKVVECTEKVVDKKSTVPFII